MDRSRLKSALLRVARSMGMFAIARRLTRNRLRILTYHGAALNDEAEFRGGLFMKAKTFQSRLAFLAKHRYPVLQLDDALARLEANNLPSGATVLTIDDGWLGTRTIMAPALAHHGFPATLYIASYYVQTQTQVFNVAADYVLWKSHQPVLDLNTVRRELVGIFRLDSPEECARASSLLRKHADSLDGAAARQTLFEDLCSAVDVDVSAIVDDRLFAYMTYDEAADLSKFGVDVQLHTHRHRFSGESIDAARREIDDNRKALEPIASSPLVHFCYPSGEYEPEQRDWLRQFGISSSTTTQSRFNRQGCDIMELGRFLDAEQIEELEFDAEMSGFYELLRAIGIR